MNGSRVAREPDHPVVLALRGSAGSVQALIWIVRDLPEGLAASVLVTVHLGEQTRLSQILSLSGPLRATLARDREELAPGGSMSRHEGGISSGEGLALLSAGPRVNRYRPAVDVM